MAIDYCLEHDREWDRDKHTECPSCQFGSFLDEMAERQRQRIAAEQIAIKDEHKELIRILRDETNNRDVFDRCKRVLGEA